MVRQKQLSCFLAVAIGIAHMARSEEIRYVQGPPMEQPNKFYVSNRAPLRISRFVKLPIGSIEPRGWLRNQLQLEADGMTGHLQEISQWCDLKTSAWADPDAKEKQGWEEAPYWLKGFGDLGYVLKDEKIINQARPWI